ncbi:hypothetical protein FB45DRAFT_1050705 [Roridomyces roridus]|uniref:Polysaccharide lyase family 8 C-terminal domain-containing protein n=1 Tax=Roridomyces roridus TaxID=1738132 RepID=A0AAD7CKJ6_9AGAR|nr:hypothetical protein FB45DRAFT_1050705 [Roridomyces roridus]
MFPGTTQDEFGQKAEAAQKNLQVVRNDGSISALVDHAHNTAYITFWKTGTSTVIIPCLKGEGGAIQVKASGNSSLIFRMDTWEVTVSDPSQTVVGDLEFEFTLLTGKTPPGWGTAQTRSVSVTLPSGGMAGASVIGKLN